MNRRERRRAKIFERKTVSVAELSGAASICAWDGCQTTFQGRHATSGISPISQSSSFGTSHMPNRQQGRAEKARQRRSHVRIDLRDLDSKFDIHVDG
jgi:hypothetical protein